VFPTEAVAATKCCLGAVAATNAALINYPRAYSSSNLLDVYVRDPNPSRGEWRLLLTPFACLIEAGLEPTPLT